MGKDIDITRVITRFKALPPEFTDDVIAGFDKLVTEAENNYRTAKERELSSECYTLAFEWLHQHFGRNSCLFISLKRISLDDGCVFDVLDRATHHSPLDTPIGEICISKIGGVTSDAHILHERFAMNRKQARQYLNWITDDTYTPDWLLSDFIRQVVLRKEVIQDILHRALSENNIRNFVERGKIKWDRLNSLLPTGWPHLPGWNFKGAALFHLRLPEQRHEFESAAWWWRCRVIDNIPNVTMWFLALHDSGTTPKELAKLVYGPLGQSTAASSAYGLLKACKSALEKRSRLGKRYSY